MSSDFRKSRWHVAMRTGQETDHDNAESLLVGTEGLRRRAVCESRIHSSHGYLQKVRNDSAAICEQSSPEVPAPKVGSSASCHVEFTFILYSLPGCQPNLTDFGSAHGLWSQMRQAGNSMCRLVTWTLMVPRPCRSNPRRLSDRPGARARTGPRLGVIQSHDADGGSIGWSPVRNATVL